MPSPVLAEIPTAFGNFSCKRFNAPLPFSWSILLNTMMRGFFRRADFRQHGIDRGDLFLGLRMADVHDVQQQIRLHHFLQRRLERLDQAVRQFADETDRVREQNILVRRQFQAARRRVQRGEQFILGQNVRAGERVEQGGFAGVGVTDDGGQRPVSCAGARRAAWRAGGGRCRGRAKFVSMRSCTWRRSASNCDSPSPPRMPMPPVCRDKWPQNRVRRGSKCCKLRQFDLHLAFARAGALRENIENQRRAVENFAVENFFQVAALRGRKFVVENHRVHFVAPAKFRKFLRLAFADERRRRSSDSIFWMPSPTTSPPAVAASSASSSSDSRSVRAVARFEFDADEENPFRPFV